MDVSEYGQSGHVARPLKWGVAKSTIYIMEGRPKLWSFFLILVEQKRRKNMETINGATYYPPVDYDAYDEHELDMYYIGDNYGLEYGEE